MIQTFADKETEKIWNGHRSTKLPNEIQQICRRKLRMLNNAVLINRPYAGGSLFRTIRNRALPTWAAEFEAETWGQFFLKFILANPAITCVIPGTSKASHMLDNVQAGFGKLPTTEYLNKMIKLISS